MRIMNSLSNLSPAQLRQAADIQERILALQGELNQLLGVGGEPAPTPIAGGSAPKPGKRNLSAAGRAAIIAGAKARWAKERAEPPKRRLSAQGLANIRAGVAKRVAAQATEGESAKPAPKRNFSAAGRARLSALAKARWATARKEGRATL
jgi:hypothetical protein